MKIEIPLQDNQEIEISNKGKSFVTMQVKDPQDNTTTLNLNDKDKKRIIAALKIM